jgi:hypothetical protein
MQRDCVSAYVCEFLRSRRYPRTILEICNDCVSVYVCVCVFALAALPAENKRSKDEQAAVKETLESCNIRKGLAPLGLTRRLQRKVLLSSLGFVFTPSRR